MIGQITPLVQVASRRIWIEAVSLHTLGCVLSAAALGAVLGTLGWALQLQRWWLGGVVGLVLLAAAAHEAGVLPGAVPTIRRQTPRWLITVFGPTWGSFLWGLDLGQGWTTQVISAGYYGLLVATVALAHPLQSAAVFTCFGLGRALPVIRTGVTVFGRHTAWSPAPLPSGESGLRWINTAVLALAAGFLLTV